MKKQSYDEIVTAALAKKDKDGSTPSASVKAKAKAKLNQKVGAADIAVIEAREKFEEAVVNGGEIDVAALALKTAEDSLTFYQNLSKELFPENVSN